MLFYYQLESVDITPSICLKINKCAVPKLSVYTLRIHYEGIRAVSLLFLMDVSAAG